MCDIVYCLESNNNNDNSDMIINNINNNEVFLLHIIFIKSIIICNNKIKKLFDINVMCCFVVF